MRFKSIFKVKSVVGEFCKNKWTCPAVQSTVSEYVQKSTIHGVAYIGDDERNKFERLWWFMMILGSIFGASYLIYQAYRTMKDNPIIESPSLTRAPIWEVPFPAVTFCPVLRNEFTSLALNKSNWPYFAQSFLPDNLTNLTTDSDFSFLWRLQALLLGRSDQNNYEILAQILPEIKSISAEFGLYSKYVEVSLQKTITYCGACVTFNMYREKDLLRDSVIQSSLDNATSKMDRLWSRDSGFTKNLPLENYTNPLRSFGPDDELDVYFNVDSKQFIRYASNCMVSFHAPDEVPQFNRHSEVISIVTGETQIEITPRLVVSEGIEKYRPEVRQCYYSHERYLRFFKNYTQNHCEMECLANYTLAKCGCTPYHLPHFSDTTLCTTDVQCYLLHAMQLHLPNFKDNTEHVPIDDCNCLPSCTQLSYKVVWSSPISSGTDDNSTHVFVHYKYPYIKKQIRTELHSISEFFSNCGGSLGLFLGVSIFSILELFYFCTARLYLHSKKRSADSTGRIMISQKQKGEATKNFKRKFNQKKIFVTSVS